MAEAFDGSRKATVGRQAYFLEVPSARSAAELSVVSFTAVERMADLYTVTIRLTHPQELSRFDYLKKDASFVIDPGDGTEPRRFSGCITRFSKIRNTRDFCAYEMEVRPKVALLTLTKASRVYQGQTAPQIIEALLRRHGLDGSQFAFKTRRQYTSHKFRLQYQMTDWEYIRLLMEQEGLYSYFTPGKFGHHLGDLWCVADDIDHYIYQPALHAAYRETAGLEAGIETVSNLQTHTRTVQESFRTADYNPADSYERKTGEANLARSDGTTHGQSYHYGTHHVDVQGAKWEAQLRHEAALAQQVVYEGESNILELRPARILRLDIELPDAPNGQVITEVVHTGARDQAYRNTFKAIPSDRRYRIPIDEGKWPRIAGTLSGRITSPGNYKYAYLTQQGLYVVRFDLDFGDWPNGGESVPLRLAKPFAGARRTGMHFPLIDGTEVGISFRDGDPNKPFIAFALHHSQHEDLITSQDRWLSRNVIRTQANNKLRFEDWEGQEGIKLSTDYGGKTQLNLGFLVDNKKKKRGEGFELRTDKHGVTRAGGGMLLSAYMQTSALGQHTDMRAALDQFDLVHAQAQELADAARAAKAEIADLKAENKWLREAVADLKQSVIMLAAPQGISTVTAGRTSVSAGKDISMSTGASLEASALRNIVMAARGALSLFAHSLGIKLLAARGKIRIQAQSDEMEIAALKDIKITSTDGKLILSADKEVWIGAGGSYLRITPSNITNATPGDYFEKAMSFQKQGPDSAMKKGTLPLSKDLTDEGTHGSGFSG